MISRGKVCSRQIVECANLVGKCANSLLIFMYLLLPSSNYLFCLSLLPLSPPFCALLSLSLSFLLSLYFYYSFPSLSIFLSLSSFSLSLTSPFIFFSHLRNYGQFRPCFLKLNLFFKLIS